MLHARGARFEALAHWQSIKNHLCAGDVVQTMRAVLKAPVRIWRYLPEEIWTKVKSKYALRQYLNVEKLPASFKP